MKRHQTLVVAAALVGIAIAGAASAEARAAAPRARQGVGARVTRVAAPAPEPVLESLAETPEPDPEVVAALLGGAPDARPVPDGLVDLAPESELASARPSWAAWRAAPEARLTRAEAGCTAKRIREWVRVSCPMFGAIRMHGGDPRGVLLFNVDEESTQVIELPLRRGDRRVFELVTGGWRYGPESVALVSEQWLPEDPEPTILVQPIRFSSGF